MGDEKDSLGFGANISWAQELKKHSTNEDSYFIGAALTDDGNKTDWKKWLIETKQNPGNFLKYLD